MNTSSLLENGVGSQGFDPRSLIAGVADAVEFLQSVDPTGWHNLVSIHPDTGGLQAQTFPPGSWSDLEDWIRDRNGRVNLYWSANEPRPGAPNAKLLKSDIASIRLLYSDLDPADGLALDVAREQVAAVAAGLADGPLPPSITLDSGGGFQFFWRLRNKLAASDHQAWAEQEGRGLAHMIDGDAVQDINRIMRLPGTINLPNARKRERGRVPRQARIVTQSDRSYEQDEIAAFVAPVAAASYEDREAAVATAQAMIDMAAVEACQAGEDLPAQTAEKFARAYASDRKFRALWEQGKSSGDISGSGYLASLASAVAPHDFDATDFATVAAMWGRTNDEKTLTARSLARAWGRVGEPLTPSYLVKKWFEPLLEQPATTSAIKWINPSDWLGKEPRPREWAVDGWIPKGEVTLLYGDGGTGKTLLAHQYATSAAAGLDWLGQPTQQARVMCFFCEDSEDELHRRQLDINRAYGITLGQIGDRLRIVSRKHSDNLLATWDRNCGELKRQAVWEQLRSDAIAFRADVVIVDTIADTYGGSEIDRSQVNAFIKSCLGRLAHEIQGSVLALGHPSVSGLNSGQGTSGSTAWSNAVRSRLYLRYPAETGKTGKGGKAAGSTDLRELEGMKANYGPKGAILKLRWCRGVFDVVAGSTPSGPSLAYPTLEDAAERAVIAGLAECQGEQLSKAQNSPYFAPRVLQQRCPDALQGLSTAEIVGALSRLESRGGIRHDVVGKNASRHPVYGYVIVADKLSTTNAEDRSAFD